VSLFDSPQPDPRRKPAPKRAAKPDTPPARPAFNPAQMKQSDAPQPGPPPALSVSQLAANIDHALKQGLPAKLRVAGEITGFNDRTHWYFSLKDDSSVVSCVMFVSAVRRTVFDPANGMEVVATGSVSHFPKWGRTQLYVEALEPVGAGALELKYRQLVAQLREKGWFDDDRKQPIPRVPRAIAVVTSKTGAALQDVLDTLRRRAPFVDVLTIDARVQGDRAAPEIVSAINFLNARADQLGIDTIILTRGGGSMEDLWAFNEPSVAEAIVKSRLPVVAAIGHETDTTIAELVADLRAATPTQAAVRAAPDAAALLDHLHAAENRLRSTLARRGERAAERLRSSRAEMTGALRARLHAESDRLHRAAAKLARKHPAAVYAARRTTLDDLSDRLARTMKRALRAKSTAVLADRLLAAPPCRAHNERAHLNELERLLQTTGPVATLRRGYSVTTTTAGGALLRSADDAKPGDDIVTRLADGSVRSTVSGGKKRRRLKKDDAPGPSLFDVD